MQDEQKTVPHSDKSLPETTVVPPGQSGVEQTEKSGGAKPADVKKEDDKNFNQPGKPVKLPSDNFDPRL
jgi:hypothetical protein